MTDCLTDEQIERYVTGAATSAETEAIEAHTGQCSKCRERVERRRDQEAFLAGIRTAYDDAKARIAESEPLREDLVPGYQILEEIHRGGQGVVYKAVQLSTKRAVALKVILGGPFATVEARKRFEREAKLAASLNHPNLVTVHDSGAVDDNLFLVMDYVDGLSITDYAAGEHLSIAGRLQLFVTVCEAVEYAHQHDVLHRDLKPANILVTGEGNPVIVDFGLARPLRPAETGQSATIVSSPGQVVGSLPYVSPEQATGDPTLIDERTDVYALGVLLYELLTGTRPPPVALAVAETSPSTSRIEPLAPSQACVGLDRRLDRIVLRALEPNKSRRYRSSGDFAAVVRTYLEGNAPRAPRARHRLLVSVTFAGLLLYGVVASWLAADFHREAMLRPPIPSVEPHCPTSDEVAKTAVSLTPDYHGKSDERFFSFTFDQFDAGLNPPLILFGPDDDELRRTIEERPLWEHFEGPNRAGSEGWSNSYVTCDWHSSGMRGLRSRTGIARSARVNALNVWRWIEPIDCKRVYYQLYVHFHGTEQDSLSCGFVVINPEKRTPEDVEHLWLNALVFHPNGRIAWRSTKPGPDSKGVDSPILDAEWRQGQECVYAIRVEVDFTELEKGASVWLDGQCIGDGLPVTPKFFTVSYIPDHAFRLNRWGFVGPSSYQKVEFGGHPDLMFQPRYVDIDDLEIGTWNYVLEDSADED